MYRLLFLLFLATPAAAQVSIGTGGMYTLIERDGHLEDARDMFAAAEYQAPIADGHWLGVLIATDGGSFSGTAVRWYYGDQEALAFPGLGVGMFVLNEIVRETTAVLGLELVLELHVPVGDATLPLSVCGGWYPAVAGDEVSMIRFGAVAAPRLFQ